MNTFFLSKSVWGKHTKNSGSLIEDSKGRPIRTHIFVVGENVGCSTGNKIGALIANVNLNSLSHAKLKVVF